MCARTHTHMGGGERENTKMVICLMNIESIMLYYGTWHTIESETQMDIVQTNIWAIRPVERMRHCYSVQQCDHCAIGESCNKIWQMFSEKGRAVQVLCFMNLNLKKNLTFFTKTLAGCSIECPVRLTSSIIGFISWKTKFNKNPRILESRRYCTLLHQ